MVGRRDRQDGQGHTYRDDATKPHTPRTTHSLPTPLPRRRVLLLLALPLPITPLHHLLFLRNPHPLIAPRERLRLGNSRSQDALLARSHLHGQSSTIAQLPTQQQRLVVLQTARVLCLARLEERTQHAPDQLRGQLGAARDGNVRRVDGVKRLAVGEQNEREREQLVRQRGLVGARDVDVKRVLKGALALGNLDAALELRGCERGEGGVDGGQDCGRGVCEGGEDGVGRELGDVKGGVVVGCVAVAPEEVGAGELAVVVEDLVACGDGLDGAHLELGVVVEEAGVVAVDVGVEHVCERDHGEDRLLVLLVV